MSINSNNSVTTGKIHAIPSNSINIQAVIEHLEKLIVRPGFDSYSEHILKQTVIMLEHFEELLFNDVEG